MGEQTMLNAELGRRSLVQSCKVKLFFLGKKNSRENLLLLY